MFASHPHPRPQASSLKPQASGQASSLTPQASASDEQYMRLALAEARQALAENEVPIGAVIVHCGRVVGAAHNQRVQLADPTAHAEMLAITQAAGALGDWRLEGATLYVTLEPCPMCAARFCKPGYRGLCMGPTIRRPARCEACSNFSAMPG